MLDGDRQAPAGLIALAEHRKAASVERGQGEEDGEQDRAEGDDDRARGHAGWLRRVEGQRRPRPSGPGPRRPRWPLLVAGGLTALLAAVPRAGQRTLNLQVRGSSPWRCTHSDLGLYDSRSFLFARQRDRGYVAAAG